MKKHNWDAIEERQGFDNPIPGAYIAVITNVEDVEEKEYLKVEWDFAEGAYKGSNRETFDRAGFWPTTMFRSYKESALGFFKAFKTAMEKSNRGYIFDEDHLDAMVGKLFGVVLGEEGYFKKNGDHAKRLYVAEVRSLEAIRKGDFKIPEFRQAKTKNETRSYTGGGAYSTDYGSAAKGDFSELTDDDGELPF